MSGDKSLEKLLPDMEVVEAAYADMLQEIGNSLRAEPYWRDASIEKVGVLELKGKKKNIVMTITVYSKLHSSSIHRYWDRFSVGRYMKWWFDEHGVTTGNSVIIWDSTVPHVTGNDRIDRWLRMTDANLETPCPNCGKSFDFLRQLEEELPEHIRKQIPEVNTLTLQSRRLNLLFDPKQFHRNWVRIS